VDLKISPITVQAQTVDRLRNAILMQHFKPHDRLVEAELCKAMGVSRTSLREALRHLEAEKLITTIPNRGPSVRAVEWEEAAEIYDVRRILEGEAAALFSQRAQPQHFEKMRSALEAFRLAGENHDPMGLLTSTNQFYAVILENCGNRIICESLYGLHARVNFLRSQSMSRVGRSTDSHEEMRRILEAIERRDAEAARAAAQDHVQRASAVAQNVLKQHSA